MFSLLSLLDGWSLGERMLRSVVGVGLGSDVDELWTVEAGVP